LKFYLYVTLCTSVVNNGNTSIVYFSIKFKFTNIHRKKEILCKKNKSIKVLTFGS